MKNLLNKKKYLYALISSGLIFILLLNIGFKVAEDKKLWTDETFSQVASVESRTYLEMILGDIKEGNISPLFYLIQKAMCDSVGYRVTKRWQMSSSAQDDPFSRIFLRIPSVFFMSLAVAMIFYYFAYRYSFTAAIYSLLTSLGSYMIWAYWAEARPYALWVFFTTVQSLLFLEIVNSKQKNERALRWLTETHILLALTSITSAGQVLIVSFLVWIFGERNLRRYILLTIAPVLLCVFYATHSILGALRVDKFMFLFFTSIPWDRMIIFAIYIFALILYYAQKNIPALKIYKDDTITEGKWYLALTVLTIILVGVYIFLYKLRETPDRAGYDIPVRQFIFLAPVGIIAATLFSVKLFRAFKENLWMQINVVMVLVTLLIIRYLRAYI